MIQTINVGSTIHSHNPDERFTTENNTQVMELGPSRHGPMPLASAFVEITQECNSARVLENLKTLDGVDIKSGPVAELHKSLIPVNTREPGAEESQQVMLQAEYKAGMKYEPDVEIVRYRSISGQEFPVTGKREPGDPCRFNVTTSDNRTIATLKQIPTEDGKFIWMSPSNTGLRGGSQELDEAKSALQYIRQNIYNGSNYKSDNKFHVNLNQDNEYERLEKAKGELDKVRQQGKSPWEVRGHNCGELSSMVKSLQCYYSRPINVIALDDESHGFAVFGNIQGRNLPNNMATWPDHLAVCDPWANIACKANMYPSVFVAKMNKWATEGKEIYDGDQEEWVKATDSQWMNSILAGTKTVSS